MFRLVFICCFSCLFLQADSIKENRNVDLYNSLQNLTISADTSSFSGKTKQYLYYPNGQNGRKISELTWEANNVYLLGLNVNYTFNDKIDLYINYTKNVANDSGVMDDWDWTNYEQPNVITTWSHHENTKVDNVAILEFGFKYDLTLNKINSSFGFGYKNERISYMAYDGYSGSSNGDLSLNGLVISFDQEYKGPYIELGTNYKYENFEILLRLMYSPIMTASYKDRHHMRTPAFTEIGEFNNVSMYNFKISTNYYVDDNQILILSYEHTMYSYARGNRIRTIDGAESFIWNNTTAIESKNSIIQLKYAYKF